MRAAPALGTLAAMVCGTFASKVKAALFLTTLKGRLSPLLRLQG
jgi:hypothetical protein